MIILCTRRPIGAAVSLYVADHDGHFPPSRLQYTIDPKTGTKKTLAFLSDLISREYMGGPGTDSGEEITLTKTIWRCPGDVERPISMSKHSYGHNQFLGGNQASPITWEGQPNPEYDPRFESPFKMDKSGAEVIFLMDYVKTDDPGKWSASISTGMWPLRKADTPQNMRPARVDFSRHHQTANALFVDGSVRALNFEDLRGTEGRYIHPYYEK